MWRKEDKVCMCTSYGHITKELSYTTTILYYNHQQPESNLKEKFLFGMADDEIRDFTYRYESSKAYTPWAEAEV